MRRAVLVTRPEPGLSETMAQLQAMGWEAMACAAMRVMSAPPLPVLEARALAITSAQALPALVHQPKERLLLTVGAKTADRARQAGFQHVEAAGGTREALGVLCRQKGLSGEELIFACGRGWNGRAYSEALAQKLEAGWVETYRVERMRVMPEVAYQALVSDDVNAILFYSVETVKAFGNLLDEPSRAYLKGVRALCLSEKIAASVKKIAEWRDIVTQAPLEAVGHP